MVCKVRDDPHNVGVQQSLHTHIFIAPLVCSAGSFFHYSGQFDPATCEDISPNPGRSDPLFIVKAAKKSD